MLIEQFVDEGLGNSAYLVGSREAKTAVLIDPLRDVDRYLAAVERNGVKLTHVLDTHLHADFVSGAREVAAKTGAVIGASAAAKVGFEHRPLADGDHIWLGESALHVCATPGHTPEHVSFLLHTADGTATALFSGGALIVGGAARTDLLGHELSTPLARHLYHTIHDKLLCLPDEVTVYPTHGAGSFCVAPTSPERVTTIGRERRSNPLAQPQTEKEFVQRALTGLPSYPAYYKHMRPINQRGPNVLGGVPELKPLSAEAVRGLMAQGVSVLDVRAAREFGEKHILGAYGIAVLAPLTTWAGWLIPFGAPLVLVARNSAELDSAVRQLICIGFEDLRGCLDGGLEAWEAAGLPVERVEKITVAGLRERMKEDRDLLLIDVRQQDEWDGGHIPGATHIENGQLPVIDALPLGRPMAVYCHSGDRSMGGISVLARRGFRNLIEVEGGFSAWIKAGFEVQRGA